MADSRDAGPPPPTGAPIERRRAGDVAAPAGEWARCWRCGKDVRRVETSCPHCHAQRRRRSDLAGAATGVAAPLTRVMAFFGLMLLTSLLYGALTSFGMPEDQPSPAVAQRQLRLMVGLELLDVVLVAVALLLIRPAARFPRPTAVSPVWLWVIALPGLLVVLLVNTAYHAVLRGYLGVAPERDLVVAATGITPVVVLAYCVQPAVFEELFFRYLALDTLRGVMGVHQAVAISSLMFGLAHVGVPLSIPMLGLVGVPLAYARVASGGLALPMALHFLHNGIILLLG